jgi:hypothetical protein
MAAEMLSGEPEPAAWVLPKTSLNATVPFLLFSYWQIILPLLRRGGSPFPTAQEYNTNINTDKIERGCSI